MSTLNNNTNSNPNINPNPTNVNPKFRIYILYFTYNVNISYFTFHILPYPFINDTSVSIIIASDRPHEVMLCEIYIVSDPGLPHAVKQHGRPATIRLRSIRAKVAQMANSGEPSHINANSHTTNDNCAECGLPNPSNVKSRKRPVNCIDAFIECSVLICYNSE